MQSAGPDSVSILLARIFWMAAGPFILLILLGQIIKSGGGWLTPFDAAFGIAVAALILARRHEFRGGNPQTSDGAPMSREDLHRYNVQVAIVGISLWVLANIVGNYVLPRFNSKEADRSTGPAPRMAQRLENTDQQPSLISWSDQRVNGA